MKRKQIIAAIGVAVALIGGTYFFGDTIGRNVIVRTPILRGNLRRHYMNQKVVMYDKLSPKIIVRAVRLCGNRIFLRTVPS